MLMRRAWRTWLCESREIQLAKKEKKRKLGEGCLWFFFFVCVCVWEVCLSRGGKEFFFNISLA